MPGTTTPTTPTAAAPPASDHTILHNLALINQAVQLLEPRGTTRALRSLPALRHKLGKDAEVLAEIIRTGAVYKDGDKRKQQLLDLLGNPPSPPKDDAPTAAASSSSSMEVDPAPSSAPSGTATPAEGAADKEKEEKTAEEKAQEKKDRLAALKKKKEQEELVGIASTLPEADAFLCLLVVVKLLDQGKYPEALPFATSLLEHFTALNRRTLDQLLAKLYFYWVRLHEVAGDDTSALRGTLLTAHRTATLRQDTDLVATLLPLLLRNYLDHGLYEQADRFVSKVVFPEETASNSQMARWFYYVGRIRAIQLSYTAAHASLLQAIRRGPSEMRSAPGFFQHAHKLAVVVELLMGEIPERRVFREPVLRESMRGYLEVAQAVRVGDITAFNAALSTHGAQFSKDRNLTLIERLRHTVLKTALRTLSLAYSRISLADISAKLELGSEEDAEYVVKKAIRDGVVVAKVDHERGEMTSRETGDVYSTGEPMKEFDRRIGFLLELYNQSVKSMRYPLNAHSKELRSADEARERERELAKEIEEGDEDADLDGPGDMDSF
ncbi:26S proteasome non-ATPase regulatory subunit [Rhodosporidiobolus nylandii]